jgi:hypothetical protein
MVAEINSREKLMAHLTHEQAKARRICMANLIRGEYGRPPMTRKQAKQEWDKILQFKEELTEIPKEESNAANQE